MSEASRFTRLGQKSVHFRNAVSFEIVEDGARAVNIHEL